MGVEDLVKLVVYILRPGNLAEVRASVTVVGAVMVCTRTADVPAAFLLSPE